MKMVHFWDVFYHNESRKCLEQGHEFTEFELREIEYTYKKTGLQCNKNKRYEKNITTCLVIFTLFKLSVYIFTPYVSQIGTFTHYSKVVCNFVCIIIECYVTKRFV